MATGGQNSAKVSLTYQVAETVRSLALSYVAKELLQLRNSYVMNGK
jgi:hypothetical protein